MTSLLASCAQQPSSPNRDVVTQTVTASQHIQVPSSAAEKTVTVTATEVRTQTVTVTAPPPASSPIDVTQDYRVYRKTHHGSTAEDANQYQLVVNAEITTGVLDVLTSMTPRFGGWNCDGEPADLRGVHIRYIRVLYTDGSMFISCPT